MYSANSSLKGTIILRFWTFTGAEGVSVISTLYMPSYSTVTRLVMAMSPSLPATSLTTCQSADLTFLRVAPCAVIAPAAVWACNCTGPVSMAAPCEVICSGRPAAPMVILRPQTSISLPDAFTGVQGGRTLSFEPAVV